MARNFQDADSITYYSYENENFTVETERIKVSWQDGSTSSYLDANSYLSDITVGYRFDDIIAIGWVETELVANSDSQLFIDTEKYENIFDYSWEYYWNIDGESDGWNTIIDSDATDNDPYYTASSEYNNKFIRGVVQCIGPDGQDITLSTSYKVIKLGNSANNNLNITNTSVDGILSGYAGADILKGGGGADVISGGTGADQIYGNSAQDYLIGGSGNDALDGGNDEDILYAGDGNDTVDGGSGDDIIIGGDGAGNDRYIGGTGTDAVKYTSAKAAITVDLVKGNATSTAGKDAAKIGTDTLSGIESVIAGKYNDIIKGSNLSNVLVGGLGTDSLYGGADKVRDVFDFDNITETKIGTARDKVYNFISGVDDIDLKTIDGNTKVSGDQKFKFDGTKAGANSVWYAVKDVDGSNLTNDIVIYGDVNGDAKADFEIGLVGVNSTVAGDFIL